jgi:hypothetical protein
MCGADMRGVDALNAALLSQLLYSLSLPGLTGQSSNPCGSDVAKTLPPPRVRWLLDRPVKPGDDT